jgi:hypothetical protein
VRSDIIDASAVQFLWKAVERVIPDVRQRVKVELIGTWVPLSASVV